MCLNFKLKKIIVILDKGTYVHILPRTNYNYLRMCFQFWSKRNFNSMTFFEAKFDNKMDTKLAEDYLLNKKEIHSIGYEENGQFETNSFNNKIYFSQYNDHLVTKCDSEDYQDFLGLAEEINHKTNLICQLEYLIRDIPMEYVKNFEIELIKQNLVYDGLYGKGEKGFDSIILMSADSHLADLGCIVFCELPVTIICEAKVAIICSLFVDICLSVGITKVRLCIVPNITENLKGPIKSTVNLVGMDNVGVVTENADIDSAVDAFLYAPTQKPWRVKRIFVQENVLERFKNALAWKSVKVDSNENAKYQKSSAVYSYESKTFLFEFVGASNEVGNATIVEAYRTVKELLSLLDKIDLFCTSIWSNNVAESNEIAHGIKATIVWINGFGHVDNPQIANAYYSLLHQTFDKSVTKSIQNSKETSLILSLKRDWLKLDKPTRYYIILNLLKCFKHDVGDRFALSCNDSFDVGKTICISLSRPVDIIYLNLKSEGFLLKEEHLRYVIDGGAIIFLHAPQDNVEDVLKVFTLFKSRKVPILLQETNANIDDVCNDYPLMYQSKIIWSSIGTVFAN